MMEQVRLCAVWPIENWLGSSLNQIQGGTVVRESYSLALEQGPLKAALSSLCLSLSVCAPRVLWVPQNATDYQQQTKALFTRAAQLDMVNFI